MRSRPRIKICGITRQSDADLAVALGADALGFVFWPRSPRAVTVEAAARLHSGLPPFVTRVGVFVNATPEVVAAAVRDAGLDVVQLHGDESAADYVGVGARVVKAAQLSDAAAVDRVIAWGDEVVPLVDAIDLDRRGGTGMVADWSLASRLARVRPIILAGGLTPANVGDAVTRVQPWGVDVSSGVEDAPGIKSATRLREFFAAVWGTQQEDV